MTAGAAPHSFTRVAADGVRTPITRHLADEVPIAIEFNGIGYAVLMATPVDIDDLVMGFALSERLIEPTDPVLSIDLHRTDAGIVARANLPAERVESLFGRVRHRVSDSSCGLCGIENIEQAMRPLPHVTSHCEANDEALFHALDALRDVQTLNALTGAVHAAACVDAHGVIRLIREDVGRHNAFDKLIGAMRRGGITWGGGFALLSSRCSYELVEKAALANCPLLTTISAPTRLAVQRAEQAGLRLAVLARPDAYLNL